MLVVSAPFHCALMQPAQDRLEKDLQELHFNNPEVPVISNIDATPKTTGEGSRQALVRQVTGAVQWAKSMQTLIGLGVKTFIEVGPGKVLTGLDAPDRSLTDLPEREDEASRAEGQQSVCTAAKAVRSLQLLLSRHSTFTGESVMVLVFFSTHMDRGSARLLMVTTTTTPLGVTKSFLGGSRAQST